MTHYLKPDNVKSIRIGEGLEYHEAYVADHECEILYKDGTIKIGTVQVVSDEVQWDTLEIEGEV